MSWIGQEESLPNWGSWNHNFKRNTYLSQALSSQAVAYRPAVSVSPRSLLEMQTLRPPPSSAESDLDSPGD